MGIGNEFIGDVECLLAMQTLRRRSLFRMTGEFSHCWKAEAELEQTFPGMRCLLLPSATVGLALLLEVLNLKRGGEILITPFGWLSNWACIRRAGFVPRFLPLNDDLQLDLNQVKARMNDQTSAVIVTHLMGRGQQVVWDLAEYCNSQGVPLLEDIAQSFGVCVHGRRAGTFGVGAWCSLNHNKILSTGDGGFVVVKDEQAFLKLSALHDQGCVVEGGKRKPAAVLQPGLSLRTNELTAAVLRAQLARFHLVRMRILKQYFALAEECAGISDLEVIAPHNGDIPFTVLFRRPCRMNYPTLADSGWHVAPRVPWLVRHFEDAMREDDGVARTVQRLKTTSAIGAGFVDQYYAVALGLNITDPASNAAGVISALRNTL